ncbi:hypothetical protein [Kitasatospora sp. NPDC059571]|uniref:hypothetical protein n=1 Tax=Kitasatospora sp. NPDC059571 TaxID=3346871 RepID=UPI0036B2CF29
MACLRPTRRTRRPPPPALQLPRGWPARYAANQDTIGDDPDLILTGRALRLP